MFIFTRSIAFAAVGSIEKRKVEFSQLRCIEKVRYVHIVDNALKFTLLSGETFVYSGFRDREGVHRTLLQTLEAAGFTVKAQKKMLLISQ